MTLSLFKNKERINNNTSPRVLAEELIPIQIYGLSLSYPKSWQIFINSNKPFLWNDGFMKIDSSASTPKSPQTSISVRWAQINKHIDIEEYINEVKKQYIIKQKKNKKDSFRILKIEPCEQTTHPAYLVYSSIIANHSVYRSFGHSERLRTLQLTTHCADTDRLIIVSITATENDFLINEAYYLKILYSLQCH